MPIYTQNSTRGNGKLSRSIELNLHEYKQLFNSMDPSPFNERDLDHDAEEFIVSWALEYPIDSPLTVRVHLSQWPTEDPTYMIQEGIHNYFAYRARINILEFRSLMKQGRTSLMIGLALLMICLLIIKTFLESSTGTWVGIARESLTIAGWVAMWKPMQIYLYDWWPIRRKGRIYAKLGKIPVEVVRLNNVGMVGK